MIFEESRIRFRFPDTCKTIKFDDSVYYKKLFNMFPGAKGVDFVSVTSKFAAFIEIKNCLGDEGNCRWRIFPDDKKMETSHTEVDLKGKHSLDIEITEKTAMTLAALAGAVSHKDTNQSSEEIGEMAEKIFLNYLADPKKIKYVILFLEGDFGSHTRSKKMIMSDLQKSIRKKMRWLNCKVSVVDSDTYDPRIFQIGDENAKKSI